MGSSGDLWPLYAFLALVMFVIVPLAIWASHLEARENARVNQGLREWDAETARLRRLYERSGGDGQQR